MSHKIATKLGIRHCGVMFDNYDLYNDDAVTGGSFMVPLGSPVAVVIAELDALRSRFSCSA